VVGAGFPQVRRASGRSRAHTIPVTGLRGKRMRLRTVRSCSLRQRNARGESHLRGTMPDEEWQPEGATGPVLGVEFHLEISHGLGCLVRRNRSK
jgi:hypothetical protein